VDSVVHTTIMKGRIMLLLRSLNLLLDARRSDDPRPHSSGSGATGFPHGQLSSAAWEGWWHDEAA
jgi:hypothetical protein